MHFGESHCEKTDLHTKPFQTIVLLYFRHKPEENKCLISFFDFYKSARKGREEEGEVGQGEKDKGKE